jgi:hypothetical protein
VFIIYTDTKEHKHLRATFSSKSQVLCRLKVLSDSCDSIVRFSPFDVLFDCGINYVEDTCIMGVSFSFINKTYD